MHLYYMYMYMYMYKEMYNLCKHLAQVTTTHGFTCVLGQIKPFCDQLDMYTCHVHCIESVVHTFVRSAMKFM